MTTTQKQLIRETKIKLARLESIGTPAAAEAARLIKSDCWAELHGVDIAEVIREFAAA